MNRTYLGPHRSLIAHSTPDRSSAPREHFLSLIMYLRAIGHLIGLAPLAPQLSFVSTSGRSSSLTTVSPAPLSTQNLNFFHPPGLTSFRPLFITGFRMLRGFPTGVHTSPTHGARGIPFLNSSLSAFSLCFIDSLVVPYINRKSAWTAAM